MRLLVSHSFGLDSDDVLAEAVRKVAERHHLSVHPRNALESRLEYARVWDEDIADLRRSFRRSGMEPTRQERADPGLAAKLFDLVSTCDVFVAVWSSDYASKYWTSFEWKTALSLAKAIVVVDTETAELAEELSRAVASRRMVRLRLGSDYGADALVNGIRSSLAAVGGSHWGKIGTVADASLGVTFVTLSHPYLGRIEISDSPLQSGALTEFASADQGSRRDAARSAWSWHEAVRLCESASAFSLLNGSDQRKY